MFHARNADNFLYIRHSMEEVRFIQVILPLRIEWEPYYILPEGMDLEVGDRVKVEFAYKEYVGVVSAVDVVPPPELVPSILYIVGRCPEVPPVFKQEIKFWREVATYYMCTVGEVYKCALQRDLEPKTERKIKEADPVPVELSALQADAASQIRNAFSIGKTVLLHGVTGAGKTEIYLKLAGETLESGRSVLFLVPEIALSRQLENRVAAVFPNVLVYHSAQTPARKGRVSMRARRFSTARAAKVSGKLCREMPGWAPFHAQNIPRIRNVSEATVQVAQNFCALVVKIFVGRIGRRHNRCVFGEQLRFKKS